MTTPPTPPPPPTPYVLPPYTPDITQYFTRNSLIVDPDVCQWGAKYPDLWEACEKYKLCLHEPPYKYQYRQFDSIMQVGPTCGLVALSMLTHGEISPNEILNISKYEGYTNNGEMFSCKNMVKLANKILSSAQYFDVKCDLRKGGLFSDEVVDKLLQGALMLVPYDADFNHSPCRRRGHTAHWALICGVLLINNTGNSVTEDPNNVYVFSRHGKSRHVAAWKLDELEKSNKNLEQFSPKKEGDGLMYVLPEGGIGGEDGLRDQFLIFEGF